MDHDRLRTYWADSPAVKAVFPLLLGVFTTDADGTYFGAAQGAIDTGVMGMLPRVETLRRIDASKSC